MGGTLPATTDPIIAQEMAERLVRKAADQKAFSFLEGIDSIERLAMAKQTNIRFGRGLALGPAHFSGLERVPAFPLTLPARPGALALV
jgi:hypothetical protein